MNLAFLQRLRTRTILLVLASILVVLVIHCLFGVKLLGNNFISGHDITNTASLNRQSKTEWEFVPPDSKSIRLWGCRRTETPFIVVHIGKAGGGSVQRSIGASILDFRGDSYYPVNQNQSMARSCFHCFPRHPPSLIVKRSFGGIMEPCHATTPLGQAIARPEMLSVLERQISSYKLDCLPHSAHCHVVYSAHNFFGSELHWLPARFLEQWWSSRWGNQRNEDFLAPFWQRLLPDRIWCTSQNIQRPRDLDKFLKSYHSCSVPLQKDVDAKAVQAVSYRPEMVQEGNVVKNWSPVYASLPVLRVVVLRDPFSWLVSKFFWHRKRNFLNMACDDITKGVVQDGHLLSESEMLDISTVNPGWVTRMSLGYIFYLCGDDCLSRYAARSASLKDLELQTESNLRQGFSVVGLLNEVDTFYDMIDARVEYMNTSLKRQVEGGLHSTGSSPEIDCCRDKFKQPQFQDELMSRSPELSALNRLYQVAIQVNRFQLQELQKCSPSSFSSSSKNQSKATRTTPRTTIGSCSREEIFGKGRRD